MHYKVLRAPPGHRVLKYRTRRLLPGAVFSADDARSDEAALLNIYQAKRYIAPHREPGKIAPPPADLAEQLAPADNLTALRAEYTEKLGKRPFPGWDADELRRRMNEGVGG